MSKTNKDYIYCEDCDSYVDFYKYANIEDTGHKECRWRYVNDEELEECITECMEDGCFNGE